MSRKSGIRVFLSTLALLASLLCVLVIALPFFTENKDLGSGLFSRIGAFLQDNLGFFSGSSRLFRYSLLPFAAFLVIEDALLLLAERKPWNYLKLIIAIPVFLTLRTLFLTAQGMELPGYVNGIGLFRSVWKISALLVCEAAVFSVIAALADRFGPKLKKKAVVAADKHERKPEYKPEPTKELQHGGKRLGAECRRKPAAVSKPDIAAEEPDGNKGRRILSTEVPVFNKFSEASPENGTPEHGTPEHGGSDSERMGDGAGSKSAGSKSAGSRAAGSKSADGAEPYGGEPMESSVGIGIYDVVRKEAGFLEEKKRQEASNPWTNFQPGNLTKKVAEDEKALRAMMEMERKAREEREEQRRQEIARKAIEEARAAADAEYAKSLADYEKAGDLITAEGESSKSSELSESSEPLEPTEPAKSDASDASVLFDHKGKPAKSVAASESADAARTAKTATAVVTPNQTVIAPAPALKEDQNTWDGSDESDYDLYSGVGGLGHAEAARSKSYLLNKNKLIYHFPPKKLLRSYPKDRSTEHDHEVVERGDTIINTLKQFRVDCHLVGITKGPTVTMYEIALAPGVKVSAVSGLTDNIAMDLAVSQVRLVAPIPGKQAVGVEVPNFQRETIGFNEIIDSLDTVKMKMPVVLGKKITGENVAMDIASAPHILIAGATGSGKSVCVNSMICSILYTKTPKEVRMIMVDPKIVELKVYNGIPHLLTPVITDPKKAIKALQYCLEEMERRYHVIGSVNVRNIANYNAKIDEEHLAREKMPYIVVIMDEFADLMTVAGKELEILLNRLSAMARAVGIHLVFATQRPSAEVVTGLIKNNLPTKIAFSVTSQINSRIIIDTVGAERLLGKGDMLYVTSSTRDPERIQGAFLSDQEVESIAEYVKTQGKPDYLDEALFEDEPPESEEEEDEESAFSGDEALYEKALKIVFDRQSASASYLQRRLCIGYNKAARLIEKMEDDGYVGPARGSKPRELLKFPD